MSPNVPNRYDVSGNVEGQYVDEAQTILVNKRGITELAALQHEEEAGLAAAYERLLGEVRIDTPLTCDLLKYIHQQIFGDLFDWAGRWRTLQISKPGVIWPAAQFLDQSMQQFERTILATYPATTIANDDEFCLAVGEIQGEFLAIHPFREGNARTIKLFTDLLAAQTGRPLLIYDQTPAGAEKYIAAASAALVRKDYQPMTDLVRESLAQGRAAIAGAGESAGGSLPGTAGALQ